MNKLLLLCLLAHVVGDYYFQTDKLSQKKKENVLWVIIHSLLYAIPWIVIAHFNTDKHLYILFGYIVLSHFIIDFSKYQYLIHFFNKKRNHLNERQLYTIDQLSHLICICILSLSYFCNNHLEICPINKMREIFMLLNISITTFIKLAILTLTLYKPTNITFSILFSKYKPVEKRQYCLKSRNTRLTLPSIKGVEDSKKLEGRLYESTSDIDEGKHCVDAIKSAGAYIGFFERILVVIFIYLNAYSALGFVITAKSVARYDNIVKNQKFAEYFLIGTLYSITVSLVIYCVLFYVL